MAKWWNVQFTQWNSQIDLDLMSKNLLNEMKPKSEVFILLTAKIYLKWLYGKNKSLSIVFFAFFILLAVVFKNLKSHLCRLL